MEILNLIEDFSHYKNNFEIEKCFQCLFEYQNFAKKFKNYSLFEKFEIAGINSKKITFLWNQIKFEKSLVEYNFTDLKESFNEIYKYQFSDLKLINGAYWEVLSENLKAHNSKIFEINSIKLEVEILKEIFTSYNFRLPIPVNRKVQKIIELSLIASKDDTVLRTLNKFFHLINDEGIERDYYRAFPNAKNKKHNDAFFHALKKHKPNRDIRIDVLVDKIELPMNPVLEEKTRIVERTNSSSIFSYLVPSRSLSNINIVEYYISQGMYSEAEIELEKSYKGKDKDSNYYYLQIHIEYKQHGALHALREIQKREIDSIILSDKEFLSFVTRLRAEVIVQGDEGEN